MSTTNLFFNCGSIIFKQNEAVAFFCNCFNNTYVYVEKYSGEKYYLMQLEIIKKIAEQPLHSEFLVESFKTHHFCTRIN